MGTPAGLMVMAATTALLLAFKAAAVLQAFDLQIAAHIGDDLLAADHGPLEVVPLLDW
jgi:hypothetical protein